MMRSLEQLELSFVQDGNYVSIIILLHADIQFNQHHFDGGSFVKLDPRMRCGFLGPRKKNVCRDQVPSLCGFTVNEQNLDFPFLWCECPLAINKNKIVCPLI